MKYFLQPFWSADNGQDVVEYAVMLAIILLLVIGTIRLIGTNSSSSFSGTTSSAR
jgi:Flp pilus assembly pilin Flp